nr:SDR family NAD(P)-dependent oxidoreductase [uncultured Oscillibacter sp.]
MLDDTDRLFQTHFWGPIALIKAVLPNMRARRSGAIINFSSIAGLRTSPGSGYYAAAKRAVEGMSEGLRAELAPLGIKVMVESCEALLRDPKDLRARENVMWASCVNTMGVFRSGVDAALEDAAIVEAGCSRLRALMEAGGVDTTLAPYGACPTMDYVKRSLAKEDYGEFTPEELHGMIAACCA